MKKEYELYFIVKPHLDKEIYETISENVKTWIKNDQGEVLFFENEGVKTLATPIKKQDKGVYILCQFSIDTKALKELEHRLRVNENIMRFIVVSLDSVKAKFKQETAS